MFKIGSNDHKISYKLCRSVLEVQRDNFRPPIIFPATFGQMASHILRSRKSQKIAKKSILAKNSNFDRVADIGRNDDIWPEMGPWGVLELFCTRNRYLNPSRSHFKKSRKIDFFELFKCGWLQKYTRRIFYRSRNFDIEISTGPNTSKLF